MIGEKNTVPCKNGVLSPVMANLDIKISNPCNEGWFTVTVSADILFAGFYHKAG